MDEKDEADKCRLQNERGLPCDTKELHQNQALFDKSEDDKPERGETKILQGQSHGVNTLQAPSGEHDPKYAQDNSNRGKVADSEREVTDPITHLPVMIHDFTSQELKNALDKMPPTGSQQPLESDVGENRNSKILSDKILEGEEPHDGLFATSYEYVKAELISKFRFAVNAGMAVILLLMALILLFVQFFDVSKKLSSSDEVSQRPQATVILATITVEAAVFVFGVWVFRRWVESKADDLWEGQMRQSKRQGEREKADTHTPESTEWLNSLLASIWPLVNPELFRSLADTLEDSMQASLPKLVNMINIEDLGQGSEALRILGVRWLPPDTTACSISSYSNIHRKSDSQESMSYKDPNSQKRAPQKEQKDLMKLVECEEGDFVSLEVAFAYRARPAASDISTKAKNAHLCLAIHLPAGIRLRKYFCLSNFEFLVTYKLIVSSLAVWVGVEGIVGVLRLRLQLIPDPPFLSRSTITFMGQPKVNLSCMPMFKHGLNIMNLPIISSFVQTSVDAAMADYVAPKSLTLDLKDMIMAEDFKKDTTAHGVVVVRIKQATGLKGSDTGSFRLKKGSIDPYVSVSWTKFGKTVWTTRVIVSVTEPSWDETGFILIGPREFNAQERLSATSITLSLRV